MAQEEIKLVGSFKDNITKPLQKLNKEIGSIGRSFESFNNKLKPITKSFNTMAVSSERFARSMNMQAKGITDSGRAMRGYRQNANKMAGAMRKVTDARIKAQRSMGMSRAQARKGGGGGGGVPVMGGTGGSGKGGGGGRKGAGGGGAAFGASAAKGFNSGIGSVAIGSAIGNMASQGIMRGLSGLKNMAMAPFQKFQSAFFERMNDEMDDIKSAGGMYALDMDLTGDSGNGNSRLFKNFNESLRFQEEINTRMAKSASNLPGTTSEFVMMNRRLTDTIQMVMENNREDFVKLGEAQGADVSMGGKGAAKEAMAVVGQNLTESLMLASAGQQGGLPMDLAIQQLMNKEQGKIKMQAFTNKFRAAFQKNPLLKNFLMRGEEELNKTAAGSAKRLELIADIFDRAIPQQQIDKMRGSLNGLMESVRSGFLDPQGGLFGLSRAVQEFDDEGNMIGPMMKDNVDQLGNVLYKITDFKDIKGLDGKLLKEATEFTLAELDTLGYEITEAGNIVKKGTKKSVGSVSQSTTYLFEQIREIGANYGSVLTQFVGMLPTIFDPFTKMTKALLPMRDMSVKFFNTFQMTNKALYENVDYMLATAKTAADKGDAVKLRKQVMGRGAISTLADFLGSTGAMDIKRAEEIKKSMTSKASFSKEGLASFDKVAASAFKEMFSALLNSDLMAEVGKMGGVLIGGIMRTTFDVINGLFTGFFKKGPANKFMEGFTEGFAGQFADMKGFDGFMEKVNDLLAQMLDVATNLIVTKVIPGLFKSLMQFIMSGFKAGPMGALISGALIGGLVLGLKAATGALWNLALSAKAAANTGLGGIGLGRSKGRMAVKLKKLKNMFLGDALGATKARGFGAGFKGGAIGRGPLEALKGMKNFGGLLKGGALSGLKMGAVGGIIKAVTGMMSGKSPLDAISEGLASAGGSAIGAAIGTIIFPGIGTAIGAFIGGGLGDNAAVVDGFKGALTSVMDTLGPLGGLLGQVWNDVSGIVTALVGAIPGMENVSEGFNLLGFIIKAVLSPFRLLELAILGVYEAYLRIKAGLPGGLNDDEKKALTDVTNQRREKTIQLGAEGKEVTGQATLEEQLATAKNNEAYARKKEASDDVINGFVKEQMVLNKMIAERGPAKPEDKSGETKQPENPANKEADPAGAKEAMEKVDASANKAGVSLDKTDVAGEKAASSLDVMETQVVETGESVKTILEGAATDAGSAITMAAKNLAQALSGAASSIKNAAAASGGASGSGGGEGTGKTAYGGSDNMGKSMPLGQAIAKERSMMPPGADLVIANSSETIIPAFAGNAGEGFKGLKFEEMESAAGFNRMASYTDQIKEIADKTANKFTGGGALGGGSATLNAMEALGNAAGLTTTSGFRPGDPGFHGANRARDLSNGGGETPEMNKVAAEMASKYGASLTELIYTPLGYSIKNGAKTGLISPDNHYHHIHVAVAEGLKNAAVFSSQQAAENYEKSMMPSGASPMKVDLSSMTANSSEFAGGGGITVGDVNVSISGADDPKAIANQVAEEILLAIEKTTYREVFTS